MSRRTTLRLSIGVLALLHAAIAAAGFLAPYDFADQHRERPYAPPTRIHFIDPEGRFHLRPFVYGDDAARQYAIRFLRNGRLFGVDEPAAIFLFGADAYGRDIFSRVLYGGRVSLSTGLAAAAVSLALGLLFGAAAGFWGGWLDQVLMRGAELVMALPWIYLLLAVRALLPLHIAPLTAFFLLTGIIGCVGWVRPARLVRGVALSARERGFVEAARGFGASDLYLLRRHVLPMTAGVVLTQATVLVPRYVLAELTLSFLGLGIGEPVPSWGNMLAEARQYHAVAAHPWLLAPGLAAIPILLGFVVLADALIERYKSSAATS